MDSGFNKADLRTGMVTKFRNGVKSIVLVDTVRSEETGVAQLLLVSREYASTDIEVFTDGLKHKKHDAFDVVEVRRFDNAEDIFKKYDLENDYEELELVWARKEATQYVIGSIFGSTDTIIWEVKGFDLRKDDIIEVMHEGSLEMARVQDVVSSDEIKSSYDIVSKVEL